MEEVLVCFEGRLLVLVHERRGEWVCMFGQYSCLCCFLYPPAQQKLYRSWDETLIGAGFTLLCGRLMLIFPNKTVFYTRCCCNEDKELLPTNTPLPSRTCSLAPSLLINYLQCFSFLSRPGCGIRLPFWGFRRKYGDGRVPLGLVLVHWESCNIVRLCYNWLSSTVWVL